MRTRPVAILFLAILPLAALACTTNREAAPGKAVPVAAATAAPAPPEVEFTREDLEEIRAAAIQYYEEKKPELWELFLVELRRGAVFPKGDLGPSNLPAIGIWKIEQNQEVEGVALVRWSIHSIAFYFGLNLAQQDGKWIVTGDFTREEFFNPEDLEGVIPPG
jgi:hypothetical protein